MNRDLYEFRIRVSICIVARLLILLTYLAWPCMIPAPSHAEEAAPLVRLPAGYAAWTINITEVPASEANRGTQAKAADAQKQYPADKSKPQPQTPPDTATKVEVTQDREKRRCVITWGKAKPQTVWEYPRYKMVLSEGHNGNVTAVPAGNPDFAVPFVSGAFDWIKPGSLVEKVPIDYNGKLCFHYKGSIPLLNARGDATGSLSQEAWIDSTTLRPVAMHDGTALGTYTFRESTEELTLPPKFLAKLSYFITAMGAGPYQPQPRRTIIKPVAR